MILDIDGILRGQRLRKCSGESRWHYGYYLLLANNFARLELDYEGIAEHFISFRGSNPVAADIERDFAEYQREHLVFVYRSGNRLWAQFDTKRSNTKSYRNAADKRSPHPPEAEYQSWLKEQHTEDWGQYHWNPSPEAISGEVQQNQPLIKVSENLEKVTSISESFVVGVGDGVGRGDDQKRNTKPSAKRTRGATSDPSAISRSTGETKHKRIEGMIQMAWEEQNREAGKCPWGGDDGKQLKNMLSKTGSWIDQQYAQCLMNMYASEGFARSNLPVHFLPKLPSYYSGPKDRFGNTINQGNGNGHNKAQQRELDRDAKWRAIASANPSHALSEGSGVGLRPRLEPGANRAMAVAAGNESTVHIAGNNGGVQRGTDQAARRVDGIPETS